MYYKILESTRCWPRTLGHQMGEREGEEVGRRDGKRRETVHLNGAN